ncbi:MAG: hypothetical protein ABI553_10430 [Chloroflexota bacterium]
MPTVTTTFIGFAEETVEHRPEDGGVFVEDPPHRDVDGRARSERRHPARKVRIGGGIEPNGTEKLDVGKLCDLRLLDAWRADVEIELVANTADAGVPDSKRRADWRHRLGSPCRHSPEDPKGVFGAGNAGHRGGNRIRHFRRFVDDEVGSPRGDE